MDDTEKRERQAILKPEQQARLERLLAQIESAFRGLDLGETEPVTIFRPQEPEEASIRDERE